MNRIRQCMVMMCLMAIFTTMANPITESQASAIASRFMATKSKPATSLRMVQKGPKLNATGTGENAAYFVFNSSQSGYVIVSGDDRAPAVLAYSEQGTFDCNQVPEAMQALLESYAEQMIALNQGCKAERLLSAGPAIRPLLTCSWSQNFPYNIMLPYVNGSHSVAGCVGTAMAQVMYYHKWPVRPTMPIPAYTTTSLHIDMPELPVEDFEWDLMQDTYLTNDTSSAAALAAAKLTLYCAQSVEMDFLGGAAGATSTRMPMMLSTYFGYKPSAHSINRESYSSEEWAEAIYSELAAGRPIVYSASKKTGAHAFICDGYDGNGMYHINWGWNGLSNGYFLLNVLNPEEQGTGSANGTYGYIFSQAAIVGIEPGNDGANTFELTSTNLTFSNYTTTRTASNFGFSVTVSNRYYNYTSNVMAVSMAWGLYQGETLKSIHNETYHPSLRPGFFISTTNKVLTFGKNITSGTYRIVPIYSEYGAGNWRPCVGADKNYIEVTIDGNTCSYTGYGTAASRDYTVNDITFEGKMHNGRPIDINVNMTNNGLTHSELLYMFVNGTFIAAGYVNVEPGETGDVPFKFMPATAGNYTLTFSWNENGSDPIATRTITVDAMPAANLNGYITVHNVTNNTERIITDNKFSISIAITNRGTTTYDEDISVMLYKQTQDNYGTPVQGKNQALVLAPGETKTLQFDMDDVTDGWIYFARAVYYSSGAQAGLNVTSPYTIVFPEEPEFTPGDVDNDGGVSISDVTALIDYLLGGNIAINVQAADVNNDNDISIADVTTLVDMLLTSN